MIVGEGKGGGTFIRLLPIQGKGPGNEVDLNVGLNAGSNDPVA